MENAAFSLRKNRWKALLACETARRRAKGGRGAGRILSAASSIIVACALIAAAGYVAYRFAGSYVTVRVGGEIATDTRLAELLSAALSVAAVFSFAVFVPALEKSLSEDAGRAALSAMPIGAREICAVKVLSALPRLLAVFCVCSATLVVPCAVAAGKNFAFVIVAEAAALPLFAVVVLLSLLAVSPFAALKRFFRAHTLWALVVAVAVAAGLFLSYSAAVSAVTEALASSSPRAFFNAERTAALSAAFSSLVPAVFSAKAAVGVESGAVLCAVAGLLAAVLAAVVTLFVLPKASEGGGAVETVSKRRAFCRATRRGNKTIVKNGNRKTCRGKNVFAVLVRRELTAVVNGGRAFAVFAPLILAPVAAGALTLLAVGTVGKLIPLDAAFPVAVTLGVACGILLGGASSSAVTSDKDFFVQLGTLPVHSTAAFAAKAAIYCGTALIAGVLAAVAAAVAANLDVAYSAAVAVTGGASATSVALVALRFDLAHPDFDAGTSAGNGKSAAVYLLSGTAFIVFVGVVSLLLGLLSYSADGAYYGYLSRLLPPLCTLIVLSVSVSYCFAGCGKDVRHAVERALTSYIPQEHRRVKSGEKTRKVFQVVGRGGK